MSKIMSLHSLTLARMYRGGVGATPPLRFLADSEKKRRRVAQPGFGLPYGANLPQFLAKKMTGSGQVTEL